MKNQADHNHFKKHEKGALHGASRRTTAMRGTKYAAAIALCLGLVVAVVLGGFYLLFAGTAGKDSALVSRIEIALGNLVGDDFVVEMKEVGVDFTFEGKAGVEASNVTIRRKSDNVLLAEIITLRVESDIGNAVSGNAGFDFVSIEDARVNADVLGSGTTFLLPPHLNKPLDALGGALSRLQSNIESQGFRQFHIRNLSISGTVLGRLQSDPVLVQSLLVEPIDGGKVQLSAEIATEFSNVNLLSKYTRAVDNSSIYEFKMTGIALREWLFDPLGSKGVVASDGVIDVAGRIGFRKDDTALDPSLKISANSNVLRIGKKEVAQVKKLDLNFRLILAQNQIELDPSEIEIGRLKATLVGGVKPLADEDGYAGPLLYDIIIKHGEFAATLDGETVIPAGFKVAGMYDWEQRLLQMNTIILTTEEGLVQGSGSFDFTGETPALKANGTTTGISVLALKQFWPFFIAEGAREWVHDHIVGGRVVSGTLEADIPAGLIFRLKDGAKLKPEHFKAVLNLDDFAFYSFGEMPPIRKGEGSLTLEGMQISAEITKGVVLDGVKKPIEVRSGSFVMDNFAILDKIGKTNIRLAGDARSIAVISDREPLRVMERIKVSARQFSGQASADIAAEFPIRKGNQYDDIKWNVLLDLQNGASSKPIAGRSFSSANLIIDANPFAANVTGKTNVDGVDAKVRLVEPIGKSGKVKRSRSITVTLNNEDREKLGIDLNPIVDGPVNVKILQKPSGDSYEVDFQNAKLSLPWIGWQKGRKIAATASFGLASKNGRNTLSDFKLNGSGFSADGTLVLDKAGLVLANMQKVSMNEGDDLAVKIERRKNAYEINASGFSYDARGVMNTLIYESTFSKAQGGRSVNLVANIKQIKGFKNRTLNDASLRYQSREGKLSLMDMRAGDARGGQYSVAARREGDKTSFTIRSDNAGNALAFTNVYTRMSRGSLSADLTQKGVAPYYGKVIVRDFEVTDEPRLALFASSVRRQTRQGLDGSNSIIPKDVEKRARFDLAEADIEKGSNYLIVNKAIIRNQSLGLTAEGLVYDNNANENMNIQGTFMPANVVNSIISKIPLLGNILSDKDDPFIGITYRLRGKIANPKLEVNPLSIVAPGVFKKVFEYSK